MQVANACRNSLNNTKSDRSSLYATQISSVAGGAESIVWKNGLSIRTFYCEAIFTIPNLNSARACSKVLTFFCPTLAGNFIFCDLADTPVPRNSLNLIPALSTAFDKKKQKENITNESN